MTTAVIGAGRMGRSIGVACALAGRDFLLIDLRPRGAEARRALQASVDDELRSTFQRLQSFGLLRDGEPDRLMKRVKLVFAPEASSALAGVTTLFEAVPETMAAKGEALAEACAHLPRTSTIASTSSTMLPLELAALVSEPRRFLNAHWLNPAYLVPLVEVAPHADTASEVTQGLMALLEDLGKVPVLCAGQPGYIVPRLQALVMNEAARMIEQGAASAADIDKAVRYGFGMRYASMGLAEFIDFGGVDILYYASQYLADRLGDARYDCPQVIKDKMASGDLGMKTGRGFYDWSPDQASAFQHESMRRFMGLLEFNGLQPVRHVS